ncbi:sigma-54-dependent Fis family transcriptional regulator [Candidatus Saganbacteria bacterium]|nr:sigma-54-dependent Fis family transcriptional regulator [Candidatus Saganbacteria bacterium]
MNPDNKATLLIVDDEEGIRDSMRMLLQDRHRLVFSGSGKDALKLFRSESPDLVLLDIRLPDIDGLEVLSRMKDFDPEVEVIMLTALNTVNYAVSAMKAGAYDYLTKPFDIETIQSVIEKVLEKNSLKRQNLYLREEIEKKFSFEKIVGRSKPIKEIFALISQVAKSDSTVLIFGESGTGKELVARAIHNLSKRKEKLFVPVNCAAIPENLLESELFGHERGAFTGAFDRKPGKFEIADGGTLFLDEVGSLPLPMQGKLLRALQEKEIERVGGTKTLPVDVRIISATNTDLGKDKFREDLFFRLNVIPIKVPPLRERREDIRLLMEHFLGIFNREFGKKIKGFTKGAEVALINYRWPGNVRELQNLIERLVVLQNEGFISEEHLPREVSSGEGETPVSSEFSDLDLKQASMKFEASFIKKALQKAGGNKGQAAKLLGIHRNTLLQIEKRLKH